MDILNLPLEELGKLFVSCIPIGFFYWLLSDVYWLCNMWDYKYI